MKWFVNLFKRKKTKVPEKIELRIPNSKPLVFYNTDEIKYRVDGNNCNNLFDAFKMMAKHAETSKKLFNNLLNGFSDDLKPDINSICKLIDKHKDDLYVLDKIREYMQKNKNKFPLIHLEYIGEYLNKKILEYEKYK